MKYLFVIVLIACFLSTNGQPHRELFRGGMFLHTGLVKNQLDFPSVNGVVTGIGGKITFRVGEHLRAGTEGYVSSFGYAKNEGQYKLGWGGLLAEYQLFNKKFTPVIGATLGGGKIHDLYMLNGNYTDNNPDEAIYKVHSSFVITPHFSVEYSLSDHINLVGKIDYVFYPGAAYPSYIAKGVRLYFGVLFMR